MRWSAAFLLAATALPVSAGGEIAGRVFEAVQAARVEAGPAEACEGD